MAEDYDYDVLRIERDDDLELRAREDDRMDRVQDFAPASVSPFELDAARQVGEALAMITTTGAVYERGYYQLLDLIEVSTKPNSRLAIETARVRRTVRRELSEAA